MNIPQVDMEFCKKFWYIHVLNKRPVFSLKECLDSYEEDRLYIISDVLEIDVRLYEEDKEKWIEFLAAAIQQNIKQQFTYLTKKQAYFLLDRIEKPWIETISDEFGIGKFFSLMEIGWVYWFQVGEETRFVVPEELKKIIKDIFFERELSLQLQKHHELSEYIEAFVHLYGAFEIQHLRAVWNQHHPEDSFAQMQLEEYIAEANKYQLVFESEENLVYAAGGIDSTRAKAMIHKLSHIPYYVPQPEEIAALTKRSPSAYFQPLEEFIRKWTTPLQSEYLLGALADDIRLGLPAEISMEEIGLYGFIDTTSTAFVETFHLLYYRVLFDSRTWLSRGHTPEEFNRMQDHQ